MKENEKKQLLFDDRLLVYIPAFYEDMDQEKAKMMYPYENRPQIILENKKSFRWCTFSLLKEQGLSKSQIEDAIQSISKIVLSLYPSSMLRKPEIIKRKEGNCGWFAFRTVWKTGGIYNVMYVFSVDGSMMLGTLGCGEEDIEGIKEMMHVLKSLEIPMIESPYMKARKMMFSLRGDIK